MSVLPTSRDPADVDAAAAWRHLLDLRNGMESVLPATIRPEAQRFLDLYLDFARAGVGRPMVLAHLGQSLDGRIATRTGDSYYVNGPENIDHLHRMRALAEAVIVGAGTVRKDDARLTTRRVSGPNPVRVVIDPRRTLGVDRRIFAADGARVIVICEAAASPSPRLPEHVEVIGLPAVGGQLAPQAVVNSLTDRGIHRLFVEGGGATVSRFLAAGCLQRLQITVAPLILGSGRHGLELPPISRLAEATRLRWRLFPMGEDTLFDCDFRS